MKTLQSIVLLLLTFLLFSGCDELITKNVDVPVYFEVFTEIDVQGDTSPDKDVKFIVGGEFDILSHPDVANAIGTPDKIKKVKITKIQYNYKNFVGNVDAVLSGTISMPRITKSSDEDIVKEYTINPVKVSESILINEQFTINGNFDGVNEYLAKEAKFQYAFVGISSHNPVNVWMVIKVTAEVSVEASIDWQGNYN